MKEKDDYLYAMRHSLAHIMATAVMDLWPNAKLGVGPVVDKGFYYDIDIPGERISEDDFPAIEKKMKQIIKNNDLFEKSYKSIDEAIVWAQENGQPYKEELLNDLKREGTTKASLLDKEMMGVSSSGDSSVDEVSFYKNGDFVDLCRGPHVESTGKVGAFKLMRIAGAYWRGDETKPQMQRLYGVAFKEKSELRDYLQQVKLAKELDHRRIGQEMDLYVMSNLVGPGLPLFTPRGTTLRNELIKFSEELQKSIGYEAIWTPHIARGSLYKKSGHYDKYPERFDVTSAESDDDFILKPMNCPHAAQIYASRPRSYKDLPLRYMETTTVYRDEKSGELHGISRVRSLTQDDSHAFVMRSQIESEMSNILSIVKDMYLILGMDLSVELSFRDDTDNYFGDKDLWQEAQSILEKVAKEVELDYVVEQGEAAFYGPKIDVHVSDALGRKWQCATVQLDFVQPERFELEYIGEDGEAHRPVMVHKAILGSIERFLSVYIEHTAGKFPVWIAPEQIRVITVNQEPDTVKVADDILSAARKYGLRVAVDNHSESVGKKIRNSVVAKVPYTVVIGEKEIESGKVTPRVRPDLSVREPAGEYEVSSFLKTVANEAKSRVNKTSF